MDGTMMDFPLTLTPILERAGKLFPDVEIVTRLPDKSLHRYSYGEFHRRTRLLAAALEDAGLKRGERVATIMWNSYAHLEAYFAVPCAGGVLHTLNFRLHENDIAYIANHAEDRFLIVDDVLFPIYERIKDKVKFERILSSRSPAPPVRTGSRIMKIFWPAVEPITRSPSWAKAMLAPCVTPLAPPGNRRVLPIPTALWFSTHFAPVSPIQSA